MRSLYIHVQLQLSISLLNRGVAACASGKDQITSDSLAVIEQVVLYTASAVSQTKNAILVPKRPDTQNSGCYYQAANLLNP